MPEKLHALSKINIATVKNQESGLGSALPGTFIIMIVLLIITGVTKSTAFVNLSNFQSIGKQLTEYGLMSLGMGICMLSGGIDLSTVYVANLSGICAGLIFQTNMPGNVALGCLAALCTGALCGTFNGILISRFHIPPMLATLGSYELFMGISVVLSGGSTVSVNGETELLSSLTILNENPNPPAMLGRIE